MAGRRPVPGRQPGRGPRTHREGEPAHTGRSSTASRAATPRTPTRWALSTFYGPGWSVATPTRHSEKPPASAGGGVTKRTNVYADAEDLATIKEAAKRWGTSEAEIIRQGIHLAAMANRVWDEPQTFEGAGRTLSNAEVRDTVADAVRGEKDSDPDPGTAV